MGWSPDLTVEQKVELLETLDSEARLTRALEWARDALAELDLAEQIRSRVSEDVDKTQREFMLRRQLDAIRTELGEGGGEGSDDYREKLAGRELPGRRARRRSSVKSRSSSARVSRAPSTGGSERGSTPCSSSRGVSGRRSASTWSKRARSSTPTTPGSTT